MEINKRFEESHVADNVSRTRKQHNYLNCLASIKYSELKPNRKGEAIFGLHERI